MAEILKKLLVLVKQRRIWAALLSGISAVAVALNYGWIAEVLAPIAGILVVHSYMRPKEK